MEKWGGEENLEEETNELIRKTFIFLFSTPVFTNYNVTYCSVT